MISSIAFSSTRKPIILQAVSEATLFSPICIPAQMTPDSDCPRFLSTSLLEHECRTAQPLASLEFHLGSSFCHYESCFEFPEEAL